MTITNINELKDHTLELGDTVIFRIDNKHHIYEVCYDHMSCKDHNNDLIFCYLDLTDDKKYELASKIYGYDTYRGCWPDCKNYDFRALTKLVKILYMLIEAKDKHDGSMPFNVFEIIEEKYISKDEDTTKKSSNLKLSKFEIKHIVKDKESQLKRIK